MIVKIDNKKRNRSSYRCHHDIKASISNSFPLPITANTQFYMITRYIFNKIPRRKAIPLHSPFLHFSLCKHPGNFSRRRTRKSSPRETAKPRIRRRKRVGKWRWRGGEESWERSRVTLLLPLATGNGGQRGGFRISVFETWYTPLDGAAQLPSDVL